MSSAKASFKILVFLRCRIGAREISYYVTAYVTSRQYVWGCMRGLKMLRGEHSRKRQPIQDETLRGVSFCLKRSKPLIDVLSFCCPFLSETTLRLFL
jgi:hypothetical protein